MIYSSQQRILNINEVGKSQLRLNTIYFFTLVFTSIFFVYFINLPIRKIFFIILFIICIIDRKNSIWFALVFVYAAGPGGLFFGATEDQIKQLPLYSITSGLSFSVIDIITIILLIKAIFHKKTVKYKNKIIPYTFIGLLIIAIIGVFIYNSSLNTFLSTIRYFFLYSVLYSGYVLLSKKDYYLIYYYLSFFIFYILLDQILVYTIGIWARQLFFGIDLEYTVNNSITGELRAIARGRILIIFLLIFSVINLGFQNIPIRKEYSIVIMATSITIFLLSATRTYFFMSFTILIIYFILQKRDTQNLFKLLLFSTLIILFFASIINIDFITENLIDRIFYPFKALISGEIENADTLSNRLFVEAPKIIEGIRINPLTGVGFSDNYQKFYNNDVGFLNTVLLVGIVGLVILCRMLLIILFRLFRILKNKNISNESRNVFIGLVSGLSGILLGFITVEDYFAFYSDRILFISLFLVFIDKEFQSASLIIGQSKNNSNH